MKIANRSIWFWVWFWLTAAVILPCSALADCTACTDSQDSLGIGVSCPPRVWVEVLPAFFEKSPADHTYVKAMKENGACEAWPCFGRDSGGKVLLDTDSEIPGDAVDVVGRLVDTPPCKWPDHFYLIIGVCHQLANRGLYYTGDTVHRARMYRWSSTIYNTYGACFWPLKKYCVERCLEHVSPWPQAISARRKGAPVSPEFIIYRKYHQVMLQSWDAETYPAVYRGYQDALFRYYVDDRLGRDFSREKASMLKKHRDETLEAKAVLDRKMLEVGMRGLEDMIGQYNSLYNTMLIRSGEWLTEKEFFDFFGLKKGVRIDVRWFLPTEGDSR